MVILRRLLVKLPPSAGRNLTVETVHSSTEIIQIKINLKLITLVEMTLLWMSKNQTL